MKKITRVLEIQQNTIVLTTAKEPDDVNVFYTDLNRNIIDFDFGVFLKCDEICKVDFFKNFELIGTWEFKFNNYVDFLKSSLLVTNYNNKAFLAKRFDTKKVRAFSSEKDSSLIISKSRYKINEFILGLESSNEQIKTDFNNMSDIKELEENFEMTKEIESLRLTKDVLSTIDSVKAVKDTSNKVVGYSDLPWKAISEVTKRFSLFKIENGGKYERENHLKPIKDTELIDAIMRHCIAYLSGESIDEKDSSHFTAIALNALMLEEQRLNNTLIDNRIK